MVLLNKNGNLFSNSHKNFQHPAYNPVVGVYQEI